MDLRIAKDCDYFKPKGNELNSFDLLMQQNNPVIIDTVEDKQAGIGILEFSFLENETTNKISRIGLPRRSYRSQRIVKPYECLMYQRVKVAQFWYLS